MPYPYKKDTDQPLYMQSDQRSCFHSLDSIIPKVAMPQSSRLELAFVAEQIDCPKTDFLMTQLQ